ncbi:MAG: two-component system response regulator [SAR324 cluster bacterium]|uniref:Two-component system response regulator n=1 Tax=SAR324 cluster bacterium TaxID=2024889 RepID=A0A2A4T3F9_9DELT|nr:MAG: two-component system response regulator [SAR324 cluster bacterium]
MGKSILVIDDSLSVRNVVRNTLESSDYEVTEAFDGMDALEKLEQKRFNLVLCDVNMPRMDGITFLKELKNKPKHKFTPVIMLTTESQASKMQEGKAAGAKAWIVKPFKPDQLLSAISKLIR